MFKIDGYLLASILYYIVFPCVFSVVLYLIGEPFLDFIFSSPSLIVRFFTFLALLHGAVWLKYYLKD